MQFGTAFTYPLQDKDWASKLLIVFALSFAVIPLSIFFFIGLIPLCILLGYMLEIINNVRSNQSVILPRWERYEERFIRGSRVLLPMVVYGLPQMIFGMCFIFIPRGFAEPSANGFVTLLMLCCVLPFVFIYTAISWLILAQGTVRFAAGDPPKIFFQAGFLYDSVQKTGGYSAQWLLYAASATIILSLLAIIPFVGWLLSAALMIPVHGHLLGQYAIHVDASRIRR